MFVRDMLLIHMYVDHACHGQSYISWVYGPGIDSYRDIRHQDIELSVKLSVYLLLSQNRIWVSRVRQLGYNFRVRIKYSMVNEQFGPFLDFRGTYYIATCCAD